MRGLRHICAGFVGVSSSSWSVIVLRYGADLRSDFVAAELRLMRGGRHRRAVRRRIRRVTHACGMTHACAVAATTAVTATVTGGKQRRRDERQREQINGV
jgi:hypothetical protein